MYPQSLHNREMKKGNTEKIKPVASVVNFKFQGNSKILYDFMEAVEDGIVKWMIINLQIII